MATMWRILLLFLSATCNADWNEEFDHAIYLDELEQYRLYWTILDDEYMEIGIEVESTGWVALGFSPNGQMPESDILIGWIDGSAKTYLQNRYTTTSRTTPVFAKDISDSLISSEQTDTTLRLRFTREIFPCASGENDAQHNVRQIEVGTTRAIFAFSNEDPNCDGSEECTPEYHGNNRGKDFINFLTGATEEVPMPPDVEFYDLVNTNFTVPAVDTTYYCKYMKFPDLSTLRHIIRVDPVISAGMEGTVHHMTTRNCESFNPIHLGLEGVCGDIDLDELAANGTVCSAGNMEWAIGRRELYYPQHVGLPLGGVDNENIYVRFQWHYDNPNAIVGQTDSSGLRFYYTETLRENSAMIMSAGYRPHYSIMIPPGADRAIYYGYCPDICTSAVIPETGLHIVSNAFHAHGTSIAAKLRHVRNNKELEPIMINNAYDNDYQEFVILSEERIILPGDELIVECHYRTTDKTMPTWGGQSTQEEMCHNWMIVYPKLTELWRCAAAPPVEVTNKFFEDAAEMGIWNGSDWYPYDKAGQFDLSSDAAIQFYNNWLTQPERQTECETINIRESYKTPESHDNFEEYPQEDLGSCATEAKDDSDLWIWLTVGSSHQGYWNMDMNMFGNDDIAVAQLLLIFAYFIIAIVCLGIGVCIGVRRKGNFQRVNEQLNDL